MIKFTSRFTDFTSIVENQLKNSLDGKTKTVAEWLATRIKSNWSGSSPSAIGQPPAIVTGELDRSIKVYKRDDLGRFSTADNMVAWSVNIETDYAGALENTEYNPKVGYNRPFLEPAIQDAETVFEAELRGTM